MKEQRQSIKKLAIMGGTFDPIHMGHLVTAEAVRHEFDIDEVLFIPTGNPPHKANFNITSAEQRYLMTVLATATNPHFKVSRMEIDREGTTYTIDTVKELKKIYGKEVKLYFITGADAIHEILTWKEPESLLQICTFIAVTRPGYKKEYLLQQVEELRLNYQGSIKFLEVPALAISSSDIRGRVAQSNPIRYLVTEAVENYINKYELYTKQVSFAEEMMQQMKHYVEGRLSPKRYAHTKGVVEMALELAKLHGVSTDKVFVAALFHDIAKQLSQEEQLALCHEMALALDSFEKEHLDLAHGKVGAALLERDWHIHDFEILDSIRYHTVGRLGMNDLEKIIYIADMIELGRKPYPAMDKIRRLAKVDLNKAMYEALCASKHYVTSVLKQEVHPNTDVLIKDYQKYIQDNE
ncbi:MAG: nicotinate-nucleotide adenylyltransferase [Cellulosilyticaceae bacterium]